MFSIGVISLLLAAAILALVINSLTNHGVSIVGRLLIILGVVLSNELVRLFTFFCL